MAKNFLKEHFARKNSTFHNVIDEMDNVIDNSRQTTPMD